jgi:hypothetical protein
MNNRLEDEVKQMVVRMEQSENESSQTRPATSTEQIQDVYVLIVREQEDGAEDYSQVVDSEPAVPTQPTPVTAAHESFLSAYVFVCCSLVLIAATIAFQLYCIYNPPIATVTIIPKSQTVTLTGTVRLGRVVTPITLSQSQTTHTTGTGHQAAEKAKGYLTFYNGQFQTVTIAAGTILSGASGVQVMTDQDASIPAANPPSFGYTTVAAHAISAGSTGNIAAYDINEACCATSVLAKNTSAFTGGQDERTFATVTQHDIHSLSTVLKTTLAQGITGALQGQLQPEEQLQLLPCSPTVSSDHQIGEEATQVKVTVSQTCSAVAYNSEELETKATTFLATQAQYKTGAGYSLFGTPRVSVTQATVNSTTPHLVFLSFKAQGTWIYGITARSQEHIKMLLAGKSAQEAVQLLAALTGVDHVAIKFSGFGNDIRLPKTTAYIHISVIVV